MCHKRDQSGLKKCHASRGLMLIDASNANNFSYTLDGYMLCNSDTTQSRSHHKQSSSLTGIIALSS